MLFHVIVREKSLDRDFVRQLEADGHEVEVSFSFRDAMVRITSAGLKKNLYSTMDIREEVRIPDYIIASENALEDCGAVEEEDGKYRLLEEYMEKLRDNMSEAKIFLQMDTAPSNDFKAKCGKLNVTVQKGQTINLNIGGGAEQVEHTASQAPASVESTVKKKVLLALPDRLEEMVAAIGDIEIVGRAGTKAETVRLAGELRPDIIILESELPGDEGISYVAENTGMETRIIMLMTKSLNDLIVGKLERMGGVEFADEVSEEAIKRLIFKDGYSGSTEDTGQPEGTPSVHPPARRVRKAKQLNIESGKSILNGIMGAAANGAGQTIQTFMEAGRGAARAAREIRPPGKGMGIRRFIGVGGRDEALQDEAEDTSRDIHHEKEERVEIQKSQDKIQQNSRAEYSTFKDKDVDFYMTNSRLIAVVSGAGHSGKTTLAAELAYMASIRKVSCALVDMDLKQFGLSHRFDIKEKKIRQNLKYPGYNKFNMLFNALNETDIDSLPDTAYRENKHLYVYTGDEGEINPVPRPEDILKLFDRLKSIYNVTIADTGEYDALAHSTVSIADTVLFVHDLSPSGIRKNERLLSELCRISNLKKFYLAVNRAEDIHGITVRELVDYYKEEGIAFRDVFTIPVDSRACLESEWAMRPISLSKHASQDIRDSFERAYAGLLGGQISHDSKYSKKKKRFWNK
ncbi:MinD-like ATPase involved in chromosome partitioning or flagellar assembly [Anaerobacterium chartisolvens]|uniref:MinD-like ATPase involved in chromosome partitioning or flagellar assembly n=1 Tax=Anaerobacterium chartisolvens TaxID=1297424 RepID=A0A369AM09_9FIRM|nr:hypothetical protein [Anaerobacterium chartisolvens]RCX10410.1 MinD-like ATPase involved in chromosome partitioning or flagellar assembly [Anaerobacterium chartisolvens]